MTVNGKDIETCDLKLSEKTKRVKQELMNQRMELISVEEKLRSIAFDGSMTPASGKALADQIALVVERLGVIGDYVLSES